MTKHSSIHAGDSALGSGVRTLVVIPTYNERENLPSLVRAVVAHAGFSVIGSTIETSDVRYCAPAV